MIGNHQPAPTVFVKIPVTEVRPGDTVKVWGASDPNVVREIRPRKSAADDHFLMIIMEDESGQLVDPVGDTVWALRPLAVGMPATVAIGSDSYGATVVGWSKSGHMVQVTRAKLLRVSSRSQDAGRARGPLFDPNTDGDRETFTRRKDGAYRGKGSMSYRLTFGERQDVRDPSF